MKVIESNMDGHRKRNSKTSIMFTLAISFLIFAASSFELLSTLIEKSVLSFVGADVAAMALSGYIHEIPIANFLDDQKELGRVVDYSFVGAPMSRILGDMREDMKEYK